MPKTHSCGVICRVCKTEVYDKEIRDENQIGVITKIEEEILENGTVITRYFCEHGHKDDGWVREPTNGKHWHKGFEEKHPVSRKHRVVIK